MSSEALRIEALKIASDIAVQNMFARRMTLENRWERRTTEEEFPELPGLDIQEIVNNYRTIMNNVIGRE